MEKLKLRKMVSTNPDNTKVGYWYDHTDMAEKLNEIIDHLTFVDKLAIRVARLEVYYKAHRKEHSKK